MRSESDFLPPRLYQYHSTRVTHRNMIRVIPIRRCPQWHASGQLYLPPALESADDMLALPASASALKWREAADGSESRPSESPRAWQSRPYLSQS